MGAFVLILIMMNSAGNYATSIYFETKGACEDAAKLVSKVNNTGIVNVICTKTGLNEEFDKYIKEEQEKNPAKCNK